MKRKVDFYDVTEKQIPQKRSAKKKKQWGILSVSGERIKMQRTMRFWFSFAFFILFLITGATTVVIFLLLNQIPGLDVENLNTYLLITAIALSCIFVGTLLAAISGKYVVSRLSKISDGMREVARGNFKARVTEKDKKNSPTEFGELERSFNQMAGDLDGIELFRNDFINNFSHEFKTPIVSIRGFARQLQSDSLSDTQKEEYISIIVSESDRLATMAQNVLLLTKLENQSIVSEKTEFYLDEQLRGCILLFEKEWESKDIDLDLDLDEIKYTFNEEMLSHVWINLFSNAIKFTPVGGRLSCRLKKDKGDILVEISDSGMGMNAEVRERIFEKFYQGDSSHTGAGNGIGLNIVQRVVTLAGGSIEVQSEPGKGSTFAVRLP